MKHKIGKEPEGVSKKRKEVGNDNPLASMFAKRKGVSDLHKARLKYNAQVQKGKEMGLDEAAQTEPVRRSENDTHDIEGTETVHAPVPKRSADPRCILKPFVPDAACETSSHNVLAPQPFQGSSPPPKKKNNRR